MAKKTLNIKLPMSIAHDMSERGELNPEYLTGFIHEYLPLARELNQPIAEQTFNYSMKVEEHYHRNIKIMAINANLAMSELLGRLLVKYY